MYAVQIYLDTQSVRKLFCNIDETDAVFRLRGQFLHETHVYAISMIVQLVKKTAVPGPVGGVPLSGTVGRLNQYEGWTRKYHLRGIPYCPGNTFST